MQVPPVSPSCHNRLVGSSRDRGQAEREQRPYLQIAGQRYHRMANKMHGYESVVLGSENMVVLEV